jgi:O-antigen ligase
MSGIAVQTGRRRRRRLHKSAWVSLAAGGTLLVSLVWLAWQSGGYFAPDYLTVGAIAFAVGGLILLAYVPSHTISTHALIGFGALAALTTWTGLSAGWAPSPDLAVEAMQRDVVHLGIFGLALLAVGSGRYAQHFVWGVLAAIVVVAGAGLVSRLYPDVIDAAGSTQFAYRLNYPFTYWNAYGAFAAMGAVLAAGLAADPRSRAVLRGLSAGASVLLFVAMYLSFSRGAWLALIAGLVALVALGAHRWAFIVTAAIVGVAATLALLRLRGYPALTLDPHLGQGQQHDGHAYAGQLAVLAGGAALAQGLVAAGRVPDHVGASLRRTLRPVGIVVAVLAVLFAVVAYGLKAASLEGWTANRLSSGSDWVSAQWQDFLHPSTPAQAQGAARLTTAGGSRSDVYRVAFDAFEGHPMIGEGAGSFERRWLRDRRFAEDLRNAHSLEFETLGELGAVGGLLLLAFLGSLIAAGIRARIRPGGLARAQVAAVGAGCSVWIVHSAVDWDWQMTGLTGMALALAAPLYPYGRKRRPRSRGRAGAPRS